MQALVFCYNSPTRRIFHGTFADFGYFGRGQIIIRNDNNVYCAGCDSRPDSGIAIF